MTRRRVRGFTTLEMLVAMAIVGLVTSQVLGMLAAMQRNAAAQQEVLETQEDTRLVADIMLADIRMAGLMVPKMVGMSSVDGGNADADMLCLSDAAGINPAQLAAATDRFGGTRLAAAYNGGADLDLVAAEMDVDGDGTNDYAVGGGVVISNGTRSHCARITAMGGGDLDIAPPAGAFAVQPTDGRVVPAVLYRITANGLERNGVVFASQVEDLQVEFGVDTNGDGELTGAEFPVHDLDGSQPADVRSLRLSLVARTEREDLGLVGGGRPGLANRAAGAADKLRRRILVSTVAPRNLL